MSLSDRKGAATEVNEIMAQIAAIDAEFAATAQAQPVIGSEAHLFRVLVATDWSSATLPLAVLKAYAEMLPVDAPTSLVFAVPHEPNSSDLEAVRVLVEEGLGQGADTAALALESFSEAAAKSCYAAIIPNGNSDALLMELSQFLVTLHHLASLASDPRRLAEEPAAVDGPNFGLARRLDAFA